MSKKTFCRITSQAGLAQRGPAIRGRFSSSREIGTLIVNDLSSAVDHPSKDKFFKLLPQLWTFN